jgi:hypothetical protein
MSNATPMRARRAVKSGTGVLFRVVTGGWEMVGRVGVTAGVSPPVTTVGDDVAAGDPVVPDEKMRRMEILSISPSATALGFSKSPMVER